MKLTLRGPRRPPQRWTSCRRAHGACRPLPTGGPNYPASERAARDRARFSDSRPCRRVAAAPLEAIRNARAATPSPIRSTARRPRARAGPATPVAERRLLQHHPARRRKRCLVHHVLAVVAGDRGRPQAACPTRPLVAAERRAGVDERCNRPIREFADVEGTRVVGEQRTASGRAQVAAGGRRSAAHRPCRQEHVAGAVVMAQHRLVIEDVGASLRRAGQRRGGSRDRRRPQFVQPARRASCM